MKVLTLDDQHIDWRIKGSASLNDRPRSKDHLLARALLHKHFPTMQILEEVSIPITSKKTLFLDFFIPLKRLAIEVHGQQHYEFIPHFHQTKLLFAQSQKNDVDKKTWCELNGIKLVIFSHKENEDEWKSKI